MSDRTPAPPTVLEPATVLPAVGDTGPAITQAVALPTDVGA
jgi:hypothetical protein